jgi:glutamate 5-kinase
MNPGKRKGMIGVKIGSNVLTDSQGLLDQSRIKDLVLQVAEIKKNGYDVVLISSGAVAAGRSIYKPGNKVDAVGLRQMWSSLGQVRLIEAYSQLFKDQGLICSQVLVTRDDFRSRDHFKNMKNCFQVLLNNNIIPIVNENDVISVTELMFTDNDELAGLVAGMLNLNPLIMLTSVDGIMNRTEKDDSVLIPQILAGDREFEKHINTEKSAFGKGGMLTKAHMAAKVASHGIEVVIANGLKSGIINDVLQGSSQCTRFIPSPGKSTIKKWLSHAKGFEKGAVVINEGALDALRSEKAISLLPVGIINIEGHFKKGDVIMIYDERRTQVGLGIARYNDEKVRAGIGMKNQRPVIHYDHLFMY